MINSQWHIILSTVFSAEFKYTLTQDICLRLKICGKYLRDFFVVLFCILGPLHFPTNRTTLLFIATARMNQSQQILFEFPPFSLLTQSLKATDRIQAPQKHQEGDNRFCAEVMKPSGGMGSCHEYMFIFSGSVGSAVLTKKTTRGVSILRWGGVR